MGTCLTRSILDPYHLDLSHTLFYSYKVPRADGTHKLFGFFPSTDDEMAVIFRKPFWEHLILTPRKEAW